MDVNEYQIGGDHYKKPFQHWDMVCETDMPYLLATATKYVDRWRKKNGVEDLRKSVHYVTKADELGIHMPGQPVRDFFKTLLGMKTYKEQQLESFNEFLSQHSSYRDKQIMMNIFLGNYDAANKLIADLISDELNDGSEPTGAYVNQDPTNYIRG